MQPILTILICVSLAILFSFISRKIKIPNVVALIILGIIIGSPSVEKIIIGSNTSLILTLGDYGLICLMFLAGFKVSWKLMKKEGRDALILAFFAAIIPFLLGTFVAITFGLDLHQALIVGVCMSITAEGTNARVLLDLKKLKSKLGSLIMDLGIIDDSLGLIIFTLIAYSFTHSFPKKELLNTGLVILAFFIGIIARKIAKKETHNIMILEDVLLYTIVPFLFIAIGLHFSFSSLLLNPILVIVIILAATIGKICGALVTKPFLNYSWKQLYLLGWGINSRGAIELAIAFIAFKANLLPLNVYSAIIVMTLITTLTFPFILTRMIKKEPNIMN